MGVKIPFSKHLGGLGGWVWINHSICIFCPKARKFNSGILKFLEKYAIMESAYISSINFNEDGSTEGSEKESSWISSYRIGNTSCSACHPLIASVLGSSKSSSGYK